jgi:hypothetical protein
MVFFLLTVNPSQRMPKVSKYDCSIDGEHHLIHIFYNSKKLFYAEQDEVLGRVLHVASSRESYIDICNYATEKELISVLHKAIESYHAKKKKSRKVIIYKMGASRNFLNDDLGNIRKGMEKIDSSDMFHDGACIGFHYEVALEIDLDGLHYHHINEDGTPGWEYGANSQEDIVIEWTAQREDAFKELYASLGRIVEKAAAIFSDSDKLTKMLDAKQGSRLLG